MANHRFGVYARRAAPLQMSDPNYVSTSGLRFFDFTIAAPATIPEENRALFTERLILDPQFIAFSVPAHDTYEDPVPVAPPPCLSSNRVTFGYFGSVHKINYACVRNWAMILIAVPKSRLLLKAAGFDHATARNAVAQLFQAEGVGVERIEFRGLSPYREMLSEYASIDIALDGFPSSGRSTLYDALWQGIPVISLRGDRLLSRVGSYQLEMAGFYDLVGDTPEACVEIAARLAADPSALADRRAAQRDSLRKSKLYDREAFIDALSDAFHAAYGDAAL